MYILISCSLQCYMYMLTSCSLQCYMYILTSCCCQIWWLCLYKVLIIISVIIESQMAYNVFLHINAYIWTLLRIRYQFKHLSLVWFMVFNATFNIILVILWQSVLLVEETGGPRENHRPVASHWQTLSHNVVSSTSRHEWGSNSQLQWW
jgi:hypothetical protein